MTGLSGGRSWELDLGCWGIMMTTGWNETYVWGESCPTPLVGGVPHFNVLACKSSSSYEIK